MRAELVMRDGDPDYYDLFEKFAELTGTGWVMNTPFNIDGKPIVMSPRDARAAFAHCGLTVMALEDYL